MQKSSAAGFTLIELLITVGIIGILAAVATPILLRARTSGNEASAIASLRTINSSQQTYMSTCGQGYFASTLMILGDPSPAGAAFISPDLSSGAIVDKSGYRLTMGAGSEATSSSQNGCNTMGTASSLFTSYYATNAPITANVSGSQWFWTNSLGTVYAANSNAFTGVQVGNAEPGVGTPLR